MKPTINALSLISWLQNRAHAKAAENGHTLGQWFQAKRKFGAAAQRATCLGCGKVALMTPHGNHLGYLKLVREHPGISGDALFTTCEFGKPLLPPAPPEVAGRTM